MIIRKLHDDERPKFKLKDGFEEWENPEPHMRRQRSYIVVEDHKEVVGYIQYNDRNEDQMNFLSVGLVVIHPEYQNTGLARKMIDMLFDQACILNLGIRISFYTEAGAARIKHIFRNLSTQYRISLNDQR